MLAGIKHWQWHVFLFYSMIHIIFVVFHSQVQVSRNRLNKCSQSSLWHKCHFQKISILPLHSLLELLGIPEGGGIVKDQKVKEVISRGVLQVCKINKSKERARIQHSIGHLWFIPKNHFSFITRLSAQLTTDMKMTCSDANKIHFHMNGCALGETYTERPWTTDMS